MNYKIIDNTLIINMKCLLKSSTKQLLTIGKKKDLKSNTLSEYIKNASINSIIRDITVKEIEDNAENYLTNKNLTFERVILLNKSNENSNSDRELDFRIKSYSKLYKSFKKNASKIFNVNPIDLKIIDYKRVSELKKYVKIEETTWISKEIKDFFANEYVDSFFTMTN